MITLRLARVLRFAGEADLWCSRVVAWQRGCRPARSRLMAENGVVAAGGRLSDWVSLGVLAASVPRDAVDDAITAAGKGAKRSDGKLPPHVMVYLVMALALFADDDYEEVAARLTETLAAWGCWDDSWSVPTSGGITQARQRLGYEPLSAASSPWTRR
jgi:hypothetical protein